MNDLPVLTFALFAALKRLDPGPGWDQVCGALMVIFPYKFEDCWVFDDHAVGLLQEPFVLGIDTMIDQLTANIPNADQGFKVIFSALEFPGYTRMALSRNYSELKVATVWMCLVDGYFHIKTREPHGSPNSGRGIY